MNYFKFKVHKIINQLSAISSAPYSSGSTQNPFVLEEEGTSGWISLLYACFVEDMERFSDAYSFLLAYLKGADPQWG